MARQRKKTLRPIVGLEICRSQIHAVVLERSGEERRPRIAARTVVWRKNAASLNGEAGRRELHAALAELVSQDRLRGAEAHVALSRDFCVTRIAAGAAGNVRSELKKLEQRAALYLGLGSGRKAVATAFCPIDARHEHGLLAVANQKLLDGLYATLVDVGLRPERIEPSLITLSRALGRRGCDADAPQLILNFAEGGLDLGISYRGQLLLDYRPGGAHAGDVASIIRQHWNRLQRYCARYSAQTNHRTRVAPLSRLYLVGSKAAVQSAFEQHRAGAPFSIEVFDSAAVESEWDVGGSLNPEHAAALGACLGGFDPSLAAGPNLLERLLAGQREPLLPLACRIGWPVAAAVLLSLVFGGLNWMEQRRCAELAAQIEQLESARARAWQLEIENARAETKMDHLRRMRQQVANVPWDQMLLTVAQCLPEGVWLNRLNVVAQESLAITGSCYDDERAFEFVRWLEQAPPLRDVQLQGMQPQRLATGPATSFTVKADFAAKTAKEG